jgi:phage gp16-like protein
MFGRIPFEIDFFAPLLVLWTKRLVLRHVAEKMALIQMTIIQVCKVCNGIRRYLGRGKSVYSAFI